MFYYIYVYNFKFSEEKYLGMGYFLVGVLFPVMGSLYAALNALFLSQIVIFFIKLTAQGRE
ncbi:hypothetical protein D1F64_18950 [Breoghania sp. L-A4]|nr:hypothetical protein D1F64_18950 [Breoghania sp. L-A4]